MSRALLFCFLFAGTTFVSLARAQEPSELSQTVASQAEMLRDELLAVRRDFAQHPEASGEEERTSAVVARWLNELGLEVRTGVGGHGVVALLRGGMDGPVVAYRAEMDAAHPGLSKSASTVESGLAAPRHICGHDAHMTIGLGIAKLLASVRQDLAGSVKFLFQPAGESLEGAEDMLRAGAFRDPRPDAVFALHVVPLPVGQVGCAMGQGLPGEQPYDIAFRGVDDPDRTAVELIAKIRALNTVSRPVAIEESQRLLQALVSEDGGFLDDFVWSEVRLLAHDPDVIGGAAERRLAGAIRTSRSEGVRTVLFRIREILLGLEAEGGTFEMRMDEPFPPTVNHPELTESACRTIAGVLGADAVVSVHASYPFELTDFVFFQERVPGTVLWLGIANPEKGIHGIPHSAGYDMDEEALVVGTKAMAAVLVDYLEANRRR